MRFREDVAGGWASLWALLTVLQRASDADAGGTGLSFAASVPLPAKRGHCDDHIGPPAGYDRV